MAYLIDWLTNDPIHLCIALGIHIALSIAIVAAIFPNLAQTDWPPVEKPTTRHNPFPFADETSKTRKEDA